MSILAMGGEMGFFVPSDSTVLEITTNGTYNGSFARCATKAPGTTAYADGVTLASAVTDCWVHFEWMSSGTVTSSTKSTFIELLDGGGIAWIRLTADGSTTGFYNFSLDRWSGSAWISIGTFAMSGIALQTFDLHIVSNSATGSANLYIAGNLRVTSGSIDLSGFTGVKKFRGSGRTVAIGIGSHFSQVVIASETTIGMRVGTVVMTGQGATHTFDSGGFANIDEAVYSDADFIQSGTAAQVELFTGTPVPDFTGYTIRALALTARAKTDGSAPTKLEFALRSAGTTYFSTDQTLDFGYGNFSAIWETNPATSAAFLSSEIAALQYGVKSIT